MANLKMGTLIGGNQIWHSGNMPLDTSDDVLIFKTFKVYHEGHKPTPAEVGAVNKAGDTMTGNLSINVSDQGGHGFKNLTVTSTAPVSSNWSARISSISTTSDKSIFLGHYNGRAILGAHNADLSAWADMYLNGTTQDGGQTFISKPRSMSTQGTSVDSLTRKDYVDSRDNLKVNKAGDTMTGELTVPNLRVNTPSGQGARFGSTTWKTLVGTSSTTGEYLFGGSPSGATSFDSYIRVGKTKFQYHNGTSYNVYHEGHKPTPEEVGALPASGKAVDSDKLDGLDSTQFLRSDVDDVMSGKLTNTNPAGIVVDYAGVLTRIANGGGVGYLQSSAKMNITGWNAGYLSEFKIYTSQKDTARIRSGNTDYRIYHEGHKPTPDEIGTYTKAEIDAKDKPANDWINAFSVPPEPDFYMPLKTDMHIKNGKGFSESDSEIRYALSEAYLKDQKISFTPNNVESVSVNFADKSSMAEWTLNYNGVNSYVNILEWKPEGEFEIECDVYVSNTTLEQAILGTGQADGNFPLGIRNISSQGWGFYHRAEKLSDIKAGLNKVKFSKSTYTPILGITYVGCTVPATGSTGEYRFFKGQISNLKLIDKTNPKNSRFYPGVIYSYVDPDSAEVPMPNSTVLVDEWCEGESVFEGIQLHNSEEEGVSCSLIGDRGFRYRNMTSTAPWNQVSVKYTMEAGNAYTMEFDADIRKGGVKAGVWINTTELRVLQGHNVWTGIATRNLLSTGFYRDNIGECDADITNIKVTKVTHGIMTNFGTTQPYVPLLGDREEYCGDYTNDTTYTRGVQFKGSNITAVPTNVTGSFDRLASDKFPIGSVLNASGIDLYVKGVSTDNRSVSCIDENSVEIQHAFQYPNTFKVIKPDDPDHPDYRGYDWTLYYNGVNSYVNIPEWKPTSANWEIEVSVKKSELGKNNVVYGGNHGSRNSLFITYNANERIRIYNGEVVAEFLKSDTKIHHIKVTPTTATVDGETKALSIPYGSITQGITMVGGAPSIGDKFKGQISNLRLTDLDNPDNSRFYKGIIKDHFMPTSTVLVDELGEDEDASTLSINSSAVGLTLTGQTASWVNSTSDSDYMIFDDMVAGEVYMVEADVSVTTGSIYMSEHGVLKEGANQFTVKAVAGMHVRRFSNPTTATMSNIKVVKTTNGTAINFGTTAPYVPHLEEGEGYVSDVTSGAAWLHGIDIASKRLAGTGTPPATFKDNLIANGSILTAKGGSKVRIVSSETTYSNHTYSVISGTDHEIQQGFQYPNVFTITPP